MDGSLWTGLAFSIVVVLVLVIWSIKRVRAPMLNIECAFPIDRLVPSLSGLTLGTAVPGNSVEVHENGAFFEILIQRIVAAQCSVHF